jgi:hypothetical protein
MPGRGTDNYDRRPSERELWEHVRGSHRLDGSCGICAAWTRDSGPALPCGSPIEGRAPITVGGVKTPTV